MSNIKSVLAATDFSDGAHLASARAALIAVEQRASLALLHVISEPALSSLRSLLPASPEVAERLIADARQALAKEADDILSALDVKASAHVTVGAVMDEILSAAAQADLIAVGARGVNPLHAMLLGSTAERLLGESTKPVLVVKRVPEQGYRRVLVAVDFCPPSGPVLDLAVRVAPQAQITLFHAYSVPFEGKLQLANVPLDSIERYRAEMAREAHRQADSLIQESTVAGAKCAIVTAVARGDASFLISQKQKELNADLIVMGHRRYSAVGYFFLGSVARHILTDASCDVLITAAAA